MSILAHGSHSDVCHARTTSLACRFAARIASLALIFAGLTLTPAAAQELTPRAYWPAPKGTKVFVAGYTYGEGEVLFDASIPFFGVDSRLNVGVLAYMQTVNLWGRSSNLIVELPYVWGEIEGLIGTTPAGRKFSGFADMGVSLSINLMGAPSMDVEEFLAYRANPHPLLGASLKLVAPTGQYDKNRLINEGANRWALRGELGYMLPLSSKWLLELEAGALFFGDDDDFLPGKKEQEPVYSAQVHLIRRFKPGFWASLNFNYFVGGRQTIEGIQLHDSQRNSKLGATMVFPVARGHSIKIGYATGWQTRFGSDFDQFLITYSRVLN
jgi:hypothetical protein